MFTRKLPILLSLFQRKQTIKSLIFQIFHNFLVELLSLFSPFSPKNTYDTSSHSLSSSKISIRFAAIRPPSHHPRKFTYIFFCSVPLIQRIQNMCFFLSPSASKLCRIRYRQYSVTLFDPLSPFTLPTHPTLDALNARYSFINGSKQFGNNDVHIAIYCHRNAPQGNVFHSKRKFTFVICILIVFDFLFFSLASS